MLIQWFPGHMKKTKELIEENLKLVDIVIEIIDARLPLSSRNPDLDKLAKNKPRVIVMNKVDLADDEYTNQWATFFEKNSAKVILANSVTGTGMKKVVSTCKEILKDKIERNKSKGILNKVIRVMIVGIPNVGKSTFINKFVGKNAAKTGNKPGVTKTKQWVKITNEFELLDTPGVLWPKFEDQEVGIKLAVIGSIKEEILDITELALNLIRLLKKVKPDVLIKRYNLDSMDGLDNIKVLEQIAQNRKFIQKGGQLDIERTSRALLDEFQNGKLGKITLDILLERND